MTNIDMLFNEMEEHFNEVKGVRNGLIKKLSDVIPNLEFDLDRDDAEKTKIKLDFVNTLSGLLKSNEATTSNKIKLTLQRKDVDNNEVVGSMVSDMLKKISFNDKDVSKDTVNNKIKEVFDKNNLHISEKELEE